MPSPVRVRRIEDGQYAAAVLGVAIHGPRRLGRDPVGVKTLCESGKGEKLASAPPSYRAHYMRRVTSVAMRAPLTSDQPPRRRRRSSSHLAVAAIPDRDVSRATRVDRPVDDGCSALVGVDVACKDNRHASADEHVLEGEAHEVAAALVHCAAAVGGLEWVLGE